MPFTPQRQKEILVSARNYISNPDHWIAGSLQHEDRVCAVGSVFRSTGRLADVQRPGNKPTNEEQNLLDLLNAKAYQTTRALSIVEVNDRSEDPQAVCAIFDAVIADIDKELMSQLQYRQVASTTDVISLQEPNRKELVTHASS